MYTIMYNMISLHLEM